MIFFSVDQFRNRLGTKVHRNYDYDGQSYVGTVKEIKERKEEQADGVIRISHAVVIQADDGEEFEFDNTSLQGKLRTSLKPKDPKKRWPRVMYENNRF